MKSNNELKILANNVRESIIKEVYNANSGHPGGSLSVADILTYIYYEELNVDPKNPHKPDRDRLVLSKGHCSPALYGVLAEMGFIPKEDLTSFRQTKSYLQGHPNMKIPGVDMSTGSLGQGFSTACGMAVSAKIYKDSYRVYAILGDGELEEGQVWEAAMFAAHYKLDNLCAVVDFNGLQIDGKIEEVMSPLPIDEKFQAFGWNVIKINGHDFDEIRNAFKSARECKGKPTVIIANTVKGKGVSFMENNAAWHGNAPKKEQYDIAINDLNEIRNQLGGLN